MANHHTRILNSERFPQFFKLYMPAHCSSQLRIPPAFLKYFGDCLPLKFNLVTSAINSWEVDMSKIDDDVYFKSGWEKFVQDNLLEFGDFLIFYYNGGSKFFVSISGKNNCLKENNITCTSTSSNTETQPSPIQETCANTPGKLLDSHKQKETSTNTPDEQIEDSSLSFDVKIQPYYMSSGHMNLPRVFYDVVKVIRPMAKLQHLGRTWDVKVANYGYRIRFTTGWSLFAMENCLGAGDVCCFKVIDVTPEFYLLDVSFCREI